MPLQEARRLYMAGLSVRNDVPPNNIQPRLVDGIHLRWAFERSIGFPWYGYYLFRRIHHREDLRRVSTDAGLQIGPTGLKTIATPAGQVSSDVELVLTDDFAPLGAAEFDLTNRPSLKYIPSDLASIVRVEIGFRQDAEVMITALLYGKSVKTSRVRGQAQAIVPVELNFDGISEIEIGTGPAAVVLLGFVQARAGVTLGWQPLADFSYPMCLPIAHPDYPCPGAPATAILGSTMALQRMLYKPAAGGPPLSYAELAEVLTDLVIGGPSGDAMARKHRQDVRAAPPTADLKIPKLSPLDLLLLASLYPGLAQVLGLYWVDQTATLNERYDYLIVADHGDLQQPSSNLLGGTAASALQYLRTNGFGDVDAFIVFDKTLAEPAVPLEPPAGLRAYALPGGAIMHAGVPTEDDNSAGLRWDRRVDEFGAMAPDTAVMYEVWRASLGSGAAPASAVSDDYAHLTESGPVLLADPVAGSDDSSTAPPTPPTDWPPFRMYFIEGGLSDGWYGYQVSGIDIFGRHSANSTAPWYQWNRGPPPQEAEVHPFAVALWDKIPPPPPAGVEAYALDSEDPLLVQDAAYVAWRGALPADEQNTVGLRVRWSWTQAHMEQAPDTREFRIYYHPGRLNALLGHTDTVTDTSDTKSTVGTDISNAQGTNAYVGARLQINNSSFRIVESEAGSPLRIRVENIGAMNEVRPWANAPCTIVLPDSTVETSSTGQPPHPLYVDYSVVTNWKERYYVVGYDDHVREQFTVSTAPNGEELKGNAANASGVEVALDGSPNLSGAGIEGSYLKLDGDMPRLYRIMAVDPMTSTVTLDTAPSLGGASSGWAIGRRLRRYEVFLPTEGDSERRGAPLDAPSRVEPVVYVNIGVSAADDKRHTLDNPKWAAARWGGAERYGNEGRLGATAKIFQVLRGRPPAPVTLPIDSEKVYATPADYHGRSFYTYRWKRTADLKTHIFRALDDAVFNVDWLQQRTVDPNDDAFFPSEPRWDDPKRQQVADELNELNALKGTGLARADALGRYRQLSNDALRVLAGLPGNEGAFTQLTVQPLDFQDPATFDRRGPDSPEDYKPEDPNVSELRAFVDAVDGRTTSRYFYRAMYVDAAHNRSLLSPATPPVYMPDVVPARAPRLLQILGGERRVTLRWETDPDPTLRRYVIYRTDAKEQGRDIRLMGQPIASIPARPLVVYGGGVELGEGTGISAAERVYAAAAFDPTADLLNGQSAQQYLPERVAPSGTKVTGLSAPDDTTIVLVYRDVRQALQFTAHGTTPLVWIDQGLQGAHNYYYRLVAEREGETITGKIMLRSAPSELNTGRAIDLTPPDPPTIHTIEWVLLGDDGSIYQYRFPALPSVPAVLLRWSSPDPFLACLVQFRTEPGGSFAHASGWLPEGLYEYVHRNEFGFQEQEYRVKVVNRAGNANVVFAPASLAAEPT